MDRVRLTDDIAFWLRVAKADPSNAYCPECSYPLRWTGGDFWSDRSPFVCDDCGFGADRDERPAGQAALLEVE